MPLSMLKHFVKEVDTLAKKDYTKVSGNQNEDSTSTDDYDVLLKRDIKKHQQDVSRTVKSHVQVATDMLTLSLSALYRIS